MVTFFAIGILLILGAAIIGALIAFLPSGVLFKMEKNVKPGQRPSGVQSGEAQQFSDEHTTASGQPEGSNRRS